METIKHKSLSYAGQSELEGSKTGRGVGHASESDTHRQLAQLADAQDVSVVNNIIDLAVDFWPEDESADDVNSYIYCQRDDDRMRE